MRRYEVLFAVALLLILVGSWALDRIVPSNPAGTGRAAASSGPLLSEAWYCPVPASQSVGSSVETANLGRGAAVLRLTGFGSGSGAAATATVAAGTALSSVVAASPAGPAEVEAFGQHTFNYLTALSTGTGASDAVCTEQPGARWLFAQASTAPGYDTYLFVANPFPEDAVISVRILAPGGDTVPPGLGNYPLQPDSQTTIYLGNYYPETTSFGLDVTASRGRIVVGRLLRVAVPDGPRGLNLDVGVPAPSTQWVFAGGSVPASGLEDIVVANPSSHEALIDESFLTSGGGAPAGQQNVAVPAGGQVTLVASDQVPSGTQHGTLIASANGVPVVAERVTVEGSGSSRAYETVFGAPGWGSSWVVPTGSPAGGTDTLGVIASGLEKASFGVTLITAAGTSSPPALAALTVAPGTRGSFDLTPYLNGQPGVAIVRASRGSIAVENDVTLPPAYRQTVETVGVPG
jgi:hypothetical protein